jgi:hypothetical protein
VKGVANRVYTAKLETKITYEGGRERLTGADDCLRVSVGVSVQQYIQCTMQRNNLIGVTTMEVSATRGMTALVYCLINSSLYTGTVQGW